MSDVTGRYFTEDSTLKEISSFPHNALASGENFYEVLRVMNGNCLFLNDHIQRLKNSIILAGYKYTWESREISAVIKDVIRKNELVNGNIRLVLLPKKEGLPVLYTYCVPFSYPSAGMYLLGVPTATFKIVRSNPNVKQYNHRYQEQVREFILNNSIYEALLLDNADCITEGSKSNVFFVGNDCIYTAPGESVLKGITREKVIVLCNNLNYRIIEKPISIDTLPEMEAVFLTGTSPKILPVNRINQVSFPAYHEVMQTLMQAYDRLILESGE